MQHSSNHWSQHLTLQRRFRPTHLCKSQLYFLPIFHNCISTVLTDYHTYTEPLLLFCRLHVNFWPTSRTLNRDRRNRSHACAALTFHSRVYLFTNVFVIRNCLYSVYSWAIYFAVLFGDVRVLRRDTCLMATNLCMSESV